MKYGITNRPVFIVFIVFTVFPVNIVIKDYFDIILNRTYNHSITSLAEQQDFLLFTVTGTEMKGRQLAFSAFHLGSGKDPLWQRLLQNL